MSLSTKEYWELRALYNEQYAYKSAQVAEKRLYKIYAMARADLATSADIIFKRFLNTTATDEDNGKKLLSTGQSRALVEKLKAQYEETHDLEILAALNAPAYAARISRVQVMNGLIEAEQKKLSKEVVSEGARRIKDVTDHAYYQTMFDTAQKTDITFTPLPKETLTEAVNNHWNGKNFSERVWHDNRKIFNEIGAIIDKGVASGASYSKLAAEINHLCNVGFYNSYRLVRTELNRAHNAAKIASYKSMGVEEYTFLATLDRRTCKHCGRLDGQHFKVSEAVIGVNLPPIHPNDRCTTVAYYDEDREGTRTARKDGINYKVDRHMTYEQWRKEIEKEEK